MTKKELITALETAQNQLKTERNLRHRKLLETVVDLYQSCLRKDLNDDANKKFVNWGKEILQDFSTVD